MVSLSNTSTDSAAAEKHRGVLASRVDLAKVIRNGIQPPAQLIPNLLYAHGMHELAGEPGCGKTLAALWMALEVIRSGEVVLYLDQENAPTVMAERLMSMGTDLDDLDRFVYLRGPEVNSRRPESVKDLLAVVGEYEPALVVFDSMADFLALSECNENDAGDVTRWYQAVAAPIAKNATVVVLDHVTKNSNGKFARGSSAKRAECVVAWRVARKRDFDRETIGSLTFTREKDRAGCLPEEVEFRVGGDRNGDLVFTPSNGASDGFSEINLTPGQSEVYEALKAHPEGLTHKEWKEASDKPQTTFSEARRLLDKKGLIIKDGDLYYPRSSAEDEVTPPMH